MMQEDLPIILDLKKRLHDDLHREIDEKRAEIMLKAANAPRQLTEEQASEYVSAETVLRGMNGVRASNCVKEIVKLYSAILQMMEWKRV